MVDLNVLIVPNIYFEADKGRLPFGLHCPDGAFFSLTRPLIAHGRPPSSLLSSVDCILAALAPDYIQTATLSIQQSQGRFTKPKAAMNSLVRAAKEVAKAGARGFASGSLPDRKVAVLGAAGANLALIIPR